MGSYRSFLPCLFTLAAPLLLAAPVHAQQADDTAPPLSLPQPAPAPPTDARRQGPELDVFRAPATTVVPPPVVAPTVIPTPVPVPAPAQPAARPATRPAARPQPTVAPRATPDPVPARPETAAPPSPQQERAPATAPETQPVPPPSSNATTAPTEPAALPVAPAPTEPSLWPWIIGGALAMLALVAAVLLRRRKADDSPIVLEPDVEKVALTREPLPERQIEPQPEPAPAPILAPPPAIEPTAPEPTPPAADRPWLDMALDITQARFSVMGVTISYALLLHNRGDQSAQDIMVRGILGNAGAQQQAMLQSFLGGHSGMPLHSTVTIRPGETQRLVGELRLAPDDLAPVTMGQRSLLIPLAAFDAAYRWGPEEGEPVGAGRTARAFIIGQEQEPPADRLAPLRLDQGPRHYRRPAARAAAELTPA